MGDPWAMERYQLVWRFLLRLKDVKSKVQTLKQYNPRIQLIQFVLNNLESYICADVIQCLTTEYFTESRLLSPDFQTVVTSHRQFIFKILQQAFLLSKVLFGQIAELLNSVERFVEDGSDEDK